jgi:4-amino-4-deoxy-L-arabinose transferase-like glycosyltransferase
MSWDEAAIGYNAFSIAKTAKDEYGNKHPFLFKSFNDFKLPGYIYLDAFVIRFFGLSGLTVRAPSALAGVLAVLTLYIITKNLFGEKVALLSAFLMAVSPWHLQFSRAAFEGNTAMTIFLSGLALFFLGFKNRLAAFASLPVMFFSLYFYYAPRLLIPFIVAASVFFFSSKIRYNLKFFKIGLALAILTSLPVVFVSFTPDGQKRAAEVSIFSDRTLSLPYILADAGNSIGSSYLFLNRRIPYFLEFSRNFASHLSPTFFFFADDPNPRHRPFNHGNFYLFEAVTILFGMIALIKVKKSPSTKLLFIWLITAPIVASLAIDTPHSLRALLMLPPLLIISAIGTEKILKYQKLRPFIIVIVSLFIANYLSVYYILYPQQDNISWAYGHKQVFEKLKHLEDETNRIVFTGYFWKPYISYLYYNKVDPKTFQDNYSQSEIGKYRFLTTNWDAGKNLEDADIDRLKEGKTTIVLSPQEYQTLENKRKFHHTDTVTDYSNRHSLFMIGEWK